MTIKVYDPEETTAPLSTVNGQITDAVTQTNHKSEMPTVNTWEIKELPSRNKFYTNTIVGRPLTPLEVKKSTTVNKDNVDEVIDSILASALSGSSINIDDICVDDKLYILYWLRAQTFINDGFQIPFYCDSCNENGTYHFTISDIQQNYLADDFDMSWFNLKNPFNSDDISFKPRTIGDEKKARYFFSKMSNQMPLDMDMLNIAIQIKTINGNPCKLEQAYNYLNSDSQAFSAILSQMAKCSFGIKDEFKVTCKKCGGEGFVPISFLPSFMLPTYSAV